MNRRTWLQRLAAFLAAALLAKKSHGDVMDCRDPAKTPRRCYQCFDTVTGEEIPKVFYYDPESRLVGRFALNDGRIYYDQATDDVARVWETRELRLVETGRRLVL